jgi:CHAD domain-containing protein
MSQTGRHPTTIRPKLPVTTMLLVRRARELQRHLPSAVDGNDTGVHQARVASRRLREAVPVLASDSKSRRKAERKIRRVTQALGTVREMDVTVQILDEFARRPGIPRDALEDVRTHVIAERDRRREHMIERLKHVDTEKLYRRLEEVAIELPLATTYEWRETLVTRVGHRARTLADSIYAAGQMYTPEHLHAVRIATKKLRYALELVADARVTLVRPLLNTLKRAQDTLGRLHDLQIIEQHVAAVQALPPTRRGAHSGGLDVVARMLGEECRHLHGRYIKQVPALLELINTCQSSTVAHIAGRGRRRPVKMNNPAKVDKMRASDGRPAVARRA